MEKLADRAGKQTEVKETCHHGIPMSEESYNEWRESFQEIEESIGLVMENGEDL